MRDVLELLKELRVGSDRQVGYIRWLSDLGSKPIDVGVGYWKVGEEGDVGRYAYKGGGRESMSVRFSPMAEDRRYEAALDAVLSSDPPRPIVRTIYTGSTPQRDIELMFCDRLADALEMILRGVEGDRAIEMARGDAIRYGVGCVEWYERNGELRLRHIPRDSVWVDDAGRYVMVEREVYEWETEYDLEFGDSKERRTYYEIWDKEEREVIDVRENGEELGRREWEARRDDVPFAFFWLGLIREDTHPYPEGLIAPWAPVWEELIKHHSYLNEWTYYTNIRKILLLGGLATNEEWAKRLLDPDVRILSVPVGAEGANVQEYIPAGPVDSLIGNYNRLRQLLYELQHYPEIMRGLATPSMGEMKATVAERMVQGYDTFIARLIKSLRRFLIDVYRKELDALSVYWNEVKQVGKIEPEVGAFLMEREFELDVRVEDVRQSTVQQKQANAMMFLQLAMGNPMFDQVKVLEYAFEVLQLPPMRDFSALLAPSSGVASSSSSSVPGPPPPGSSSVPETPQATMIAHGETEVANALATLNIPDSLKQAVVEAVQRNPKLIGDVRAALSSSDPEGSLAVVVAKSGG